MGGQACVVYGAAEFSRDIDLVVACDSKNLSCLRAAIDDLQADCIAVPPFEQGFLEKGQAVHFRCRHPEATNMRVDVMSKMRGLDDFGALWARRTTQTALLQEERQEREADRIYWLPLRAELERLRHGR